MQLLFENRCSNIHHDATLVSRFCHSCHEDGFQMGAVETIKFEYSKAGILAGTNVTQSNYLYMHTHMQLETHR